MIPVSIGSIFIDDIVYPDGRTDMDVLGGGAVYAAAGMALFGALPGLMVRAGQGLPTEAMHRLATFCDLRGLSPLPLPQVRAWQIFEYDGRRTEVLRVEQVTPFRDGPPVEALPDVWRDSPLYCVLDAPNFLRWREHCPDNMFLWEPNQPCMIPENAAQIRRAVGRAQIVSPNLLEAQAIYGPLPAEALVEALLNDGVQVAVIRMGERGSLMASAESPAPIHVSAVPVPQVVDVTGAGNTYNGAFLMGYVATGDLAQAGAWGAVAASFAIEQVGLFDPVSHATRERRDARLSALSAHWPSADQR
jgi:sugar/nucleoside kinase (ribokinase family)